MKFLSFIFLLLTISCSQKNQSSKNQGLKENEPLENERYGTELIRNDFLKFSDQDKVDSLKNEITSSFYIYSEETSKFAHIDAEELAEFNFDFFIPQLNKMLEKRNVNLVVKTTKDYEKTNDIIINDKKINLYKSIELENQTFWDLAPRNFFRSVNEILKSKNVDEKFYLLYNGNDLSTLLLTDKQFIIIKEYYKNNSKESPYIP